jgi:hypothetical protein
VLFVPYLSGHARNFVVTPPSVKRPTQQRSSSVFSRCFVGPRRGASAGEIPKSASVTTPGLLGAFGVTEHFPDHHLWTGNLPVISKPLHRPSRAASTPALPTATDDSFSKLDAETQQVKKWTGNMPVISRELAKRRTCAHFSPVFRDVVVVFAVFVFGGDRCHFFCNED